MSDKVEVLVDGILPRVIEWRHQIHQNPEVALDEHKTAALVRSVLSDAGVAMKEPFIGTDVVAMLGEGMLPNVTLRADMDALPLQEKTGFPYESQVESVMHACGHDGHTAILMGAAVVLSQLQSELKGSVRFVFQPGEEVVAAGRDLVEAGALLDPEPSAVFALHGWPGIPVGVVSSRPGDMFAAAEMFKIKVKGYGAHGSMPHKSIDPIVIGCRIVDTLQGLVSRETDAHDALVVSVCQFNSGLSSNIIPDEAVIAGTVRYYNPELGKKVRKRIEEIAVGICTTMGTTCDFEYQAPYMPMRNDAAIVSLGEEVVNDLLGKDRWQDLKNPTMGGEDFAYYLKDYPGAMFCLGVGEECYGLHNPRYDFNDEAIKNGVMFMVSAALKVVGSGR